jgi:hypothetical protein
MGHPHFCKATSRCLSVYSSRGEEPRFIPCSLKLVGGIGNGRLANLSVTCIRTRLVLFTFFLGIYIFLEIGFFTFFWVVLRRFKSWRSFISVAICHVLTMTLPKYSDRVYGSLDWLFDTVIRPICIIFPLPWLYGVYTSQLQFLGVLYSDSGLERT